AVVAVSYGASGLAATGNVKVFNFWGDDGGITVLNSSGATIGSDGGHVFLRPTGPNTFQVSVEGATFGFIWGGTVKLSGNHLTGTSSAFNLDLTLSDSGGQISGMLRHITGNDDYQISAGWVQ